MSATGLITGDAPPFILLVFIMGSMYSSWTVLKEIEEIPGGVYFKSKSRALVYFSILVYYILGSAVVFRIFQNGIVKNCDFIYLDSVILIGILVSYTLIIINALIPSRIKRKYQEEIITTVKSNTET